MTSRFCTNYSAFSRLLNFNSTPAHSAATAMGASTHDDQPDLESGKPTQNNDEQQDWKRTGKAAQTVGLGGVGVSVTLIVNSPAAAATHVALYTAYLSVVGLGLFTGMGLSFYSILMPGSQRVGWVQTRLMCFTLFFVAIACFLRLHLALPFAEATIGTASVLFGVAIIVIYLCVGRSCKLKRGEC